MNKEQRLWYQKKRYIVPLTAVGVFSAVNLSQPDYQKETVPQIPYTQTENTAPVTELKVETKTEAKKKAEPECHSSYSGCLNPDASDYDCAGGSGNGPYYTGAVRVIGPDVFGLDRDNDGWGCE